MYKAFFVFFLYKSQGTFPMTHIPSSSRRQQKKAGQPVPPGLVCPFLSI
jgi:hypothetical protein